ncbi:MAG TPA: hypothetical protein VM165_17085 [Planctomycetaceae bacterium]|nr:hypothetical protein [Planctomycetaceae bacterium]
MISGFHVFNVVQSGNSTVRIPLCEIKPSDMPAVDKVSIQSIDDFTIKVNVAFAAVLNSDDAYVAAVAIAERVADCIAATFGSSVRHVVYQGGEFKSATGTTAVAASATLSIGGKNSCKATRHEMSNLTTAMSDTNLMREGFRNRLRCVLAHDDPVAKFMHLYSILLELQSRPPNHPQAPVDAFILGRDKTTPMVGRIVRGNAESHTIIRALRNEVGHVVPGTTLQTTRDQMEQWLPALIGHVRAAIDIIP